MTSTDPIICAKPIEDRIYDGVTCPGCGSYRPYGIPDCEECGFDAEDLPTEEATRCRN